LAVTALVLGIIGCVAGLIPFFFVIAFLMGALAIVFGALGRKRRAEEPRSRMATAGLILGVVSVGLGVVGVVILTTVVHKVNDTINEAFSTVLVPADTADPTRDTTAGLGGDVGIVDDQQLTISGEPLPQHDSSASVDVAVGTMAPTISGTAFDGTPLTINSSQGPYLLVFVAHWCPHCNAEIPRLIDWSNTGGAPAGLQVFGIATANDPSRVNYPPQPWLEAKGWPWSAMPDQSNGPAAAGAAAEAFGADGWPYMVLVGADGTVTARVSGEVKIEDLQTMVDDTMAGAAAGPATTAAPVDTPTVSLPAITPTELKVTTLIAGSGPAVKAGDTVSVYYVGALADGTEFDSNFGSGQPIAFTVGVGQLIAGWDVGLIGAQAGGRYQLDIPADMAYGSDGSGGIPPNAALIFVVQVTTITPG